MNLLCQTLTVTTDNHIAHIVLNRPDKKNAMNVVMIKELISVAERLKKDKHIRAVMISGEGADFCSGMDVAELNNPKKMGYVAYELLKPKQSIFQQVALIWQDLPMPVIAVIDGVCLGAGLQLALGADFRVAAPTARMGLLESKWGLVADMGITASAFDVPKDALKQLAMTAQIIDANTAHQQGLVSVIDERPLAFAQDLCQQIAARSPDAVLAAKRVINKRQRPNCVALYQEKLWQIKLITGHNRKIALARAHALKEGAQEVKQFVKRQFD